VPDDRVTIERDDPDLVVGERGIIGRATGEGNRRFQPLDQIAAQAEDTGRWSRSDALLVESDGSLEDIRRCAREAGL